MHVCVCVGTRVIPFAPLDILSSLSCVCFGDISSYFVDACAFKC